MTRDDISSMLREACDPDKEDPWGNGFWRITHKELEKFTELLESKIRADVRKECAAICRKEAAETDKHLSIVIEALEDCAYLIEKRGEK